MWRALRRLAPLVVLLVAVAMAAPAAAQADADEDGVLDAEDNCPLAHNPAQADLDADGAGDACDPDADGDGVPNGADLCPASPAAGQPVDGSGCPVPTTKEQCRGGGYADFGFRNQGACIAAIRS
jgi:hypothetical protein